MTWRWLPGYPTSDNRLYEVPTILSDNFTGIETILGVEHATLSSTGASGQHSPGRVSAVYEGATAQITALTDVPEGALAYDTTVGYWKKYVSSSWLIMTNVHSRVRAFKTASSSATLGGTLAATGDWVIFNSERYDELAEYNNATGIFTAKGSGDYLILATVSVCAGAAIPTTIKVATATSNETAQFGAQPAGSNYARIDEYPTPDDADFVYSGLSGNKDRYVQSQIGLTPVPLGATGLYLTAAYRAKGTGCSCNNTCYSETCSCYNTCYGYSCACYAACYGYAPCTCNNTCYQYQEKVCWTCYNTCYGYVACSCNYTCYGYVACSCNNACYSELPSCTCNALCYNQFETTIAPLITLSGSTGWVEYEGDYQQLTGSHQLFEKTWTVSPSTGLEWLRDELNKLGHFGLKVKNDGGIESGCYAVVSQEYITFGWYPSLPVYILRVYKNNAEVEKVFQPIINAGTESDQTIHLSTTISLNPGDTIRVAFVKVSDVVEQIIGEAGGTSTSFAVHRIGGQCV